MPRRKDTEIYTYKLKSGKTKYGFKTYVGINKENGKAIKVNLILEKKQKPLRRK